MKKTVKKWAACLLAAVCILSLAPASRAASASDVAEAADTMLWYMDQYPGIRGAKVLDMNADEIPEVIIFYPVYIDFLERYQIIPYILKWGGKPGAVEVIEIVNEDTYDFVDVGFYIVKNSKNNYYYIKTAGAEGGGFERYTGLGYWEEVSGEVYEVGDDFVVKYTYKNSNGASGPYTEKECNALRAKYTVVEGFENNWDKNLSDWFKVKDGDKQPWGGTATARAELKNIIEDYSRPSKPFADIPKNFWCVDAVDWAIEEGITNGTTATSFSPNATCTRAQILTFLYRAAGEPEVTAANPFTDVKESDYFCNAAIWAYEKGMVGGDTFAGATPCTRAETVTHLWKYAGSPEASGAAFTDVAADADYAQAVSWAVANGVTNGTSATAFSPDATCTRAQIVTFLYRAFAE